MERLAINRINDKCALWQKAIESNYELLGIADDVCISPVKYYFSSKGFGIILSKDILIILGDNKNKIRNEIARLMKKVNA